MAAFAYYNNYYARVSIKKFYKDIEVSDGSITKAHKLRNSNHITLASSELINKDNTSNELMKCIKDLSSLIDKYVILHTGNE